MNQQSEITMTLGGRLRELRARKGATQRALAEALGVGSPLISGYENDTHVPPPARLRALATYFSVEHGKARGRLPLDSELDERERGRRDELLRELSALVGNTESAPPEDLWTFPPGQPIVILVGQLDAMTHAYSDERNPNYTDLLNHADLDALMELHGHVRMRNPGSDVSWLRADRFGSPDHLGSHLVILGGPGLNQRLEEVLHRTPLPIDQREHRDVVDGEVFYVDGRAEPELPKFLGRDTPRLTEDVGVFARLSSPFAAARTLTWCSGIFSRGVLGAVRVLTDKAFREQNGAYIDERFGHAGQFAILFRVPVLVGRASTPDFHDSGTRLFEWSDSAGDRTGRGRQSMSEHDEGGAMTVPARPGPAAR